MALRTSRAVLGAVLLLALSACANPFGRQYEYEEQFYLSVSGSVTVMIDASIASLVALRGLALDPKAEVDRDVVRKVFEGQGCRVSKVGRPWTRHGRNFVQVVVEVADVRTLAACRALGWSTFSFEPGDQIIRYHQVVGASAGGDPGAVNWDGSELVAFRLHLPSVIRYHNVKRLSDGANGDIDRGNIVTWEQRLSDRRAGTPVDIEVRMDPKSILYNTLWMFAGAFAAALVALAAIIWWLVRKGRRQVAAAAKAGRPPV